MKRFLIPLFVLCAILVSCRSSATQEKQVRELEESVAKCIKEQLHFPYSYRPIEYRVDTAFAPLETPVIFDKLKEAASIYEKLNDAKKDLKRKEDLYEMNKPSYYNKNQTNGAEFKIEKAKNSYLDLLNQIQTIGQEIADLNLQNKKPSGFKIVQKYTAKTMGGEMVTCEMLLFVDSNKQISASYLKEDIERFNSMLEDKDILFGEQGNEVQKALSTVLQRCFDNSF